MRAPSFWWRPERSLAAHLLSPLGALVGAVAARRMREPGVSLGVPVICIGNPTVGGAGKTPTALYLARRLARRGHRPSILTRGYGGRVEGPIQVDPVRHRAIDVGDEPLLLASVAPTYVARERPAGLGMAVADGADVVLMDDGFQNPSVEKALSLLVIDAGVGIGNGLCLPAGPLRAPLAPQLARAQAVLVIGEGEAAAEVVRMAHAAGLAVLTGRLAPNAAIMSRLIGRRVLAFAGIGRPEKFFATLRGLGVASVATMAFADHHPFNAGDIAALVERAAADDLLPVTTEKDAVRLTATPEGRDLLRASIVLPVQLVLEAESVAVLDRLVARLFPGR
ncbi:tetraacyldisaccharide 4'-kinase [Ancylobacter oerskovii]|uniref:Tetraacyldisaccharide 4'-kinase n=1 Tax=Ancylobacter oerskovii TaxID=459519 RepID=A0ABW4YVN9_9HYPH|nr:tetraacyldisaccharide 4'-kinase [Ancylobacter oerskovii]MBS7543163.1 tetraacyldisaccharide 4'-kinase [Ancylobacter oerskovii]